MAMPIPAHTPSPFPSPSPPLPQEDKVNQVLPIGGPGRALTALDQANMLFDITGRPSNLFPVPVALMDGIIGLLDLLAKGYLYKEIAERMQVSYATVHTHIRHIYEKLHVRSRTEAVAKHLNQGRSRRELAGAA